MTGFASQEHADVQKTPDFMTTHPITHASYFRPPLWHKK